MTPEQWEQYYKVVALMPQNEPQKLIVGLLNNPDLTEASLSWAVAKYREAWRVDPDVLVCGPHLVHYAYKAVQGSTVPRLQVVILPSFPVDAWFVAGTEGAIYSEGA